MNQETLKTILPLYLGQYLIYQGGKPNKIVGYDDYEDQQPNICLEIGFDVHPKELGKSGTVLLLRSLSSMTEEEAREVCGFIDFEFKGFEIRDQMVVMYDIDLYKLTLSDDGEIQTPFPVNLGLIPFLCSRGFDCFGLIQAGIAKEANTNNN